MTEQYSNILKALGGQNQMSQPSTPAQGGLTLDQQAQNYDTFSKLMHEGVYLPDLLKRLDDMENKIKTLESQPKQDTNAELLAVMEQAVKNDSEVKAARQRVADVKTAIIAELCMKDPRYCEALEAYKTTVNRIYIKRREPRGSPIEAIDYTEEQTSDRGAAS